MRITARQPVDIDCLDGLVVGGGDDISAELYGGTIEPNVRVDAQRDALEKALLCQAYERDLPVLGICRGAQMINITRDGRLHGDIYEIYRNAPRLRTVLPKKTITIDADSMLGEIMECNPCKANALHHQSIDEPGEGLRIVARDQSDIVQAIEAPLCRFLIGVQWHPELLVFSKSNMNLFKALVLEAASPVGSEHGTRSQHNRQRDRTIAASGPVSFRL